MIDKIRDKKQLVIEETGCDAEQASVVLESTGLDVGKAIKVINSLRQHIIIIKGKFKAETHNIYGLLIVIADIKVNRIVRLANIVTCNPSVYQTSLKIPWHEFEKTLYALRLADGSLQETTQKLQEQLRNVVFSDKNNVFFSMLEQKNRDSLGKIFMKEVKTIMPDDAIVFHEELEEINLLQFKELRGETDGLESYTPFPAIVEREEQNSLLILEIELMKGVGGINKPAKDAVPGELVWAKIIDQRDIAQYVSRLLGCKVKKDNREEAIPLAVPIEAIHDGKLQVRFGPGILGQTTMQSQEFIDIIADVNRFGRFWQKVIKKYFPCKKIKNMLI